MSVLVRLYPSSWRERYGDELEAILEDDPPSPYDSLDLLLGALDAHLHLRGLGRRSEHRKGIPMSLRLAGSAAIAGGGLWIAMLAISAVVAATGVGGPDWVQFTMILVAQVALLVALAGLSAFQAHRYRTLVWVAFLVPAAGVIVSLVGSVGEAIRPDEVLFAGFSGWSIWMSGMIATLIGSALFGAVTYRMAALSRTGSLSLIVGPVIALAAIGTSLLGGTSEVVGPYLLVLGGLVFGSGWIMLGLDAIRRDAPRAVDQPA